MFANQAPPAPISPSSPSQTKQVAPAGNRAVTLYRAMADKEHSRSPLFLEALTTTPQSFGELSSKVRQPWDPTDPSAASARAVFRNIRRTESWLIDHGLIDDQVARVDSSQYDREGACRYYTATEDRKALDDM